MFGRQKELASIVARLETVEKLLQMQAEALTELQDKHVRLRGKVYAHKMHRPDDDTPKNVEQMTRDELRRSLTSSGRFVPGRPAKHE